MTDPLPRFIDEHFKLNSITDRRQDQVLVALDRLQKFADKPLLEIDDQTMRAWLVSLLGDGLTPSTVNWYLKMVKPFYRWAWRVRLLGAEEYMRMHEVAPPRGSGQGPPRPYTTRELGEMWREVAAVYPYTTPGIVKRFGRGTSPVRSIRKHAMRLQLEAMIELALVCGLRRSEIYNLSIADVHFDNKYIVAHGKRVDQNPKVREVPYPDSTREAIRAWFRMRAMLAPEPGARVWLSVTGPIPQASLSFDRMADILPGAWTLHRLRHTCATERLRAGMDIEKLQRFLGHATVQQTLVYAQLVRGDIHKAAERSDADFQRAIRRAA